MVQQTTYGVYVSGVAGSLETFEQRLVEEGMSEARARTVVESMPCFVKRDVPLDLANEYKAAFERAGAWVVVENWQTTRNPAAFTSATAEADRTVRTTGWGTPQAIPRPPRKPPRGTEPLQTAVRPPALAADEPTLREPGEPPHDGPHKRHVVQSWRPVVIAEEPWLKRRAPTLITVAIGMVIASYLYGCQRVMRQSHAMRGKAADIGVALENLNALGAPVTDDDIIAEVQVIGHSVGLDIRAAEVAITAEPLRFQGRGRACRVVSVPDTVALLPAYERERFLRNAHTCDLPRFIVGIEVSHRARWGLFAHTIAFTRYAPARDYQSNYE